MLQEGSNPKTLEECRNTNKKFAELKGELETEAAQSALVDFLKANLAFTMKLLLGENRGSEIYPVQEIFLRTIFEKDQILAVCGRGFSKSTLGSMAAMLYAIFNPNIKIGICSAGFRQARGIFTAIEDWSEAPSGVFLKQCIKDISHRADAWEMRFNNGSKIVAIPLGVAGKIRGYRFNVMIIDELLLLSDKIITEVIKPFMAIQDDPVERQKTRVAEDRLIKAGKMKEEDRFQFPANKLIGLTSASYEFEFLYTMYKDYVDIITKTEPEPHPNSRNYAVFQMSYEAAPEGLYDKNVVEEAKRTASSAQFNREYRAQFTGDSAGFYSARNFQNATLKAGQKPTLTIIGKKDKKYVLGIDPNYNDAETSDDFAMAVGELNEEDKTVTWVHGYALASSSLKKRGLYVSYLLDNFNIVYVILDKAGGPKFIQDLNEMGLLSRPLTFYDNEWDSISDQKDGSFDEAMKIMVRDFNPKTGNMCHAQYFSTDWIREANETLSGEVERLGFKIGSVIDGTAEAEYDAMLKSKIPIFDLDYITQPEKLEFKEMGEKTLAAINAFIEHQNVLAKKFKEQCVMIEVTTSPSGAMRFDLPKNVKNAGGKDKIRKDLYSASLLMAWGAKCYFKLTDPLRKRRTTSFIPQFTGGVNKM